MIQSKGIDCRSTLTYSDETSRCETQTSQGKRGFITESVTEQVGAIGPIKEAARDQVWAIGLIKGAAHDQVGAIGPIRRQNVIKFG